MQGISLILRHLHKIRNSILPPYSKSHVILLLLISGFLIRTLLTYRRSSVPIGQSNQKQPRSFQCRSRWKLLTFFSSFYHVDCTNPFLQALVNGPVDRVQTDVCTNFNPLYSRIATDFRSFQPFQLSDLDELRRACPECHLLQIIDGKLHVIRRSTSSDFQTRSRSVRALFQYVIDTFDHIPNMEFLFHVGDAVGMKLNLTHPSKCPVFGFARKMNNIVLHTYSDGVVTIPCFSFWNWPEAKIERWNEKMMNIKQTGEKKPFDRRKGQVFWRGARTGQRTRFVNITNQYPHLMDVSFMSWSRSGFFRLTLQKDYRTLEEHCDYKYLLHLEGNTFSGRLKYLLLCGSPVIYTKLNGYEEFWYHLLKDQENILIVDSLNETQLLHTINQLIQNPERAGRIGMNGRDMVLKYLNEQAIICYLRNVLLTYSKLINYQVIKRV